ncbi:MAG: hypothetical protein IT370_03350 [Deltaproteobacteria bacterium]|nr:hypothetical protein [Deltaproteobacteria bacterium]
MKTWHLAVIAPCVLVALVTSAGARPRYPQDDVNDRDRLRRIHEAMDPVNKDLALFDGTKVAPSADVAKGEAWANVGIKALQEFRYQWEQITELGKTWDDAVKLKAKYEDIKPYFEAAGPAFRKAAADQAAANAARQRAEAEKAAATKAAADAEAERKRKLEYEAAVKIQNQCAPLSGAVTTFDEKNFVTLARSALSGGGGVSTVNGVNELRAMLERLGKICQNIPDPGKCSGKINEQTPTQICELATRRTEVLQNSVLAALAGQASGSRPVTVEELRNRDGWIETTQPFSYAENLTFTPAAKAALMKQYQPLFQAAGMTVPEDHPMWAKLQANKDAMRANIEALAPTWPVPGKTCKGYWCAKAKKALKEFHPKAKLLKVLMDDTVHVTTSGGRAVEAYLNGWLLYQLPGEKFCQLRAWTVTENSPSRAAGVPLYFVRIQKCK